MSVGINLVAFAGESSGLGAAVEHLQNGFRQRDVRFVTTNLDAGGSPTADTAPEAGGDGTDAAACAINFFFVPLGSITYLLPRLKPLLLRPGALNVVGAYWELTVLPERYKRALRLFDAIVGMSQFVEATLERELAGPALVSGVQPVFLPAGVAPDRRRFKLPEDAFVFVSSFDPLSDPARKNPQAVLEAFKRAFPSEPNVRLVFKANVGRGSGGGVDVGRFVRDFTARVALDPRVELVTARLSYEDVLGLYASADAFVSLHRSEGLGLGMLESMALGRPVIATGWSGNRSFMSPRNSCLVGYGLVPVRAKLPDYSSLVRGSRPVWAEPDVEDAARWMRRLAGEPGLAGRIGEQARADYLAYQQRATRLHFVDDLEALHECLQATRPDRALALAERIDAVVRQAQEEEFTIGRWFSGHLVRQFDRHVGWRIGARRGLMR